MCGIAGILNFDKAPVNQSVLKRMTDAIAHRGPDDEGIWVAGNVGLGHRRLSIRDLSLAGHQPMSDPTEKVHVVFNGEIYNYQELRLELEKKYGHVFRSTCDTELLPAGWMAWGEALFEKLQGMFAIAIWDSRFEKLILARDPVGIKPLFFSFDRSILRFGSEVKALLADESQSRRVNPESFYTFLTQGYVDPDSTLLYGIKQVKPGNVMSFSNGHVKEHCYWKPVRNPDIFSYSDALDEFLPLWHETVNSMLVSDVPVGVLQSGGIDSSLVSLALRGHPSVTAFTAGFSAESHDESALAAKVCAVAGLPHKVVSVMDDHDPEVTFRAVAHAFDGQVADSSAYAVYNLSREVSKHVKVVLAGDGSDEFFGGYTTYTATRMARRLQYIIPGKLAEHAGKFFSRIHPAGESRIGFFEVLARFCFGLASPIGQSHALWRRHVFDHDLHSLWSGKLMGTGSPAPLSAYAGMLNKGSLDEALLSDQSYYLPGDLLPKVDAMSMAHSLEVRVPFLDRRVMEFASRVDGSLMLPLFGRQKFMLRKAADILGAPKEIVQGRKLGFNIPVSKMLRHELLPLAKQYFEAEPDRFTPYLNPDALKTFWLDHLEGRRNHSYLLWTLATFAAWHETI